VSADTARERLVVNFHGIGEPWEGVPADERPYWCPRADWPGFADALAGLAAEGGVQLEITFDDGNLSDLEDGLPALVDRGLTATFHPCAGRIGKPRYLAEDDIKALLDAGMGIGSHGWNHVDLRGVDAAELDHEARDSQARLSEVTERRVTQFAIPFGSYDRRVLRSLRGYDTVYTSDRTRAGRSGRLTPRMSYVAGWQPADLARFASEPYSAVDRLRRLAVTTLKRLR